jgi:rhomboid protease GluP
MELRSYLGSALVLSALVAVFVLEVATGVVASDDGLIALGALPDTDKLDGQYWRWLSFGFLHWDLTHLLLNTALLLVAGPAVERRVGPAWLLIAFFAATVASGIGISAKHHFWPSEGASIGASGGMFGLLGLAFALTCRFPPNRPLTRLVLGFVVAGGFAYSLVPGVSMVGHVCGFAVGVFLAFVKSIPQPRLAGV